MKIGESRQLGGSAGVTRLRPKSGANGGGAAPGSPTAQDITAVMGIPEAEFTPEVREAVSSLLEEATELRAELEQQKKRICHLEKLADEDALVPVCNRRSFVRELSRMLSYADRYDAQISVLYFDIDDMKSINDTYGHAAGDAAIAHVANLLAVGIRDSDVVGRLSGDEFGIILANAPESEAEEKAEHLRRAISVSPFEWKGRPIAVTISAGAYTLKGGEDASTMLDRADRAMYARKPAARRMAV